MTGATLKGLGSLVTLVNVTASGKNPSAKEEMNFGDIMNKAGDKDPQTNIGPSQNKLGKTDAGKIQKDLNSPKKPEVKNTVTKQTDDTVTAEQTDALNEKASEIVSKIADELNVSEQEVEDAIETLGLSPLAILDTDNLKNVVLTLTNETDPMAMVTNENLFNTLKDLTAMVDAAIVDLAEDMDIEFSDVVSMIEQAEAQLSNTPEMQMSVEVDSDSYIAVEESTSRFESSVSISNKDAEIEMNDEKEITLSDQTEKPDGTISFANKTIDPEKDKEDDTDAKEDSHTKHTGENGIHLTDKVLVNQSSNPISQIINDALEAKAQEPMTMSSFISTETRDIMNQIMDSIKVNIKPDMDELEMQLHPESLGTVKVNLTNEAGKVTAEFKVSNDTVKEAVEAQIIELKQTLKDSGVKIEAVNVSVDTSKFDSNLWQGKGQNDNLNQNENKHRPHKINLNDLNALFESEATQEEILAAEMMEMNGNTVDYQA